MLVYQAGVALILALLLLNTMNNLRLAPGPSRRMSTSGPLVSILIPARNEERAIARCVESLAQQDYPNCEILVLDDQSEDSTAALVEGLAQRYPQVRLLRGRPLPPEWPGKAYACAQLAHEARGDWLLFVDADTIHAPSCVSLALQAAYDHQADLLTLMPRLTMGSFGEALLLPTIPLAFMSILPLGLAARLPTTLLTVALGPFLLFRRETYLRIGGHEAVRTEIVEDVRLSRLVKRQGGRVVWLDGGELMSVRMYHNFGEAWHGLAKSAFAAIDYSLLTLLIGLPCCAAVFLAPYGFLAWGLLSHTFSIALCWLPLAQLGLIWLSYLLLIRRFHLRSGMLFLHGATILAIILFTAHSAFATMLGNGVSWKGRSYQFSVHRSYSQLRVQLALALSVLRLLLIVLLIVLGWRWGRAALRLAALIPLLAWTLAWLANTLKRAQQGWLEPYANVALSLACLIYLQLSGLTPVWLIALALATLMISLFFVTPRSITTLAAALMGGVVLIIAGQSDPAISVLLLGWAAGVLLLSGRSFAQTLAPRFHRPRSP
ncbi:MAG TPA: glycosyltransferase [Ktedonobacterales bacterium]|nr:glycosyltransferase [Ktedonobacterales bacterium]